MCGVKRGSGKGEVGVARGIEGRKERNKCLKETKGKETGNRVGVEGGRGRWRRRWVRDVLA